jgi:hypothetical protein
MPYYRRRYRSRWPYRSWRRGSVTRSSQAGRRTFNVSIPTSDAFQMTVGASNFWSNLVGISPYFTFSGNGLSHAALTSSLLYKTYTKLYDEVKVNSVYVKISLMTNVGTGGLVPAVNLVSVWDRNVKRAEIIDGEGIPTTATIQTGSESQSTLIVNNSRAVVSRYNKASDLQERTTFHDCSTVVYSSTGIVDQEWSNKAPIGYCPGLMFALQTSTAPGAGSSYVFDVAVEVRWNVTFRNPKFGLSGSSAKGIAVSDDQKFTELSQMLIEEMKDEEPETEKVVLKKKVKIVEPVYEEEVLEDDKDDIVDDDDEESQVPLTQPVKVKKAGKKSST